MNQNAERAPKQDKRPPNRALWIAPLLLLAGLVGVDIYLNNASVSGLVTEDMSQLNSSGRLFSTSTPETAVPAPLTPTAIATEVPKTETPTTYTP